MLVLFCDFLIALRFTFSYSEFDQFLNKIFYLRDLDPAPGPPTGGPSSPCAPLVVALLKSLVVVFALPVWVGFVTPEGHRAARPPRFRGGDARRMPPLRGG